MVVDAPAASGPASLRQRGALRPLRLRRADAVKALALGATAVLIGRPYCYGLSYGGAEGVSRCLDILVRELEMALILIGRQNIAQVDDTVLYSAHVAR